MPKKQNTDETLENFLSKHDAKTTDYEEVETLNLERDTLHAVTIHNHHTFDGKFGPATVVTYENDEGKFKTYLGGFEVTHFNNFIVGKELPLKVQLARVQQDSASNEGRAYNRLVIDIL
tara:strand:+ start:1011 stop:1367 length:357 start_codon:yes stop_codon:yes gene_type:complete